ncbi:TBC1 domain family member 25 isoform X3 [Eurytemora carolleeae]|uniref:TBC1 domain family member 25 isoform X3 n=1 Tax=Eurytemora carolleeae TaxID=1294199 RepID=UPI000C77FE60|nr:TBC1 domain family member 25 isoform X3 [Eurytemora carolleeae]|eukprot:XP_023339520.1 TBC1 domain family member 25-like isoform X3 [Eurytemora affinis]
MASLFEYEREAIRIKARRMDIEPEECRKFSVDPNITSFEVLQSILCRAFELPSGDISINYLHSDRTGKEVWTPLLSDWDLDTAILGSADYGLQLQVKLLETGSLGEISSMEKGIVSPVLEYGQSIAKELQPVQRSLQEVAANAKAAGAVQVSGLQGLVSKSSVQASGFFKRHYENTLPGLASKMRTALNIDLEERNEEPTVPPVTDAHFRTFLNKVGQMVSPREFRLAVYRGGLEPSLRKIGWKHLLNVYPAGMTGGERIRHLRELSAGYSQLKSDWMDLVLQGRITDDVKTVINMVRKDVLRTDRQHPFYAGEGNHNVTSLFNILTTYALNHPSVSYCQGMSDLASPILVIMVEESHAYICFTALMNRLEDTICFMYLLYH